MSDTKTRTPAQLAADEKKRGRKRGARGATSPQRLHGAEQHRKALELRKAGYSYPAIAKAMGLRSVSTAYQHVKLGLDECKAPPELVEDVRQLESERLDKYLFALEAKAKRGDPEAIQAALRVHTSRARLYGLTQDTLLVGGAPGAPVGLHIFLPAEEPAAVAQAVQDAPAAAGVAGGGVATGGAPAGAVEASKP